MKSTGSDDNFKEYINQLRDEALEAKKCFTQYSFQTLAFASAAIGFILNAAKENPFAALSVIPVTLLLIVVSWIGIYKFVAANRAYGYQMYLEKAFTFFTEDDSSKTLNDKSEENLSALSLILDKRHWEQTFRIMRVTESTIFNKIYISPYRRVNIEKSLRFFLVIFSISIFTGIIVGFEVLIFTNIFWCKVSFGTTLVLVYTTLRFGGYKFLIRYDFINYNYSQYSAPIIDQFRDRMKAKQNLLSLNNIYPWFMIKDLLKHHDQDENQNIFYHAGTYLKNILRILFIMQLLSLSPLLIAALIYGEQVAEAYLDGNLFSLLLGNDIDLKFSIFKATLVPISLTILFVFILTQFFQISRRRVIIEQELHSISSFSEIWHIVAVAHYRAYKTAILSRDSNTFHTYDDELYMGEIIDELKSLSKLIFNIKKWYRPNQD